MHDVLIAGGGFAAVWTAAAAARYRLEAGLSPADLSIAVVSPDPDLVLRPRLYERAPGGMRVPLARVLDPIGVEHVRSHVDDVEHAAPAPAALVRGCDGTTGLPYRRLVIATGSRLVRPRGVAGSERFHDVDTLRSAEALERHLHRLAAGPPSPGRLTALVVGAGFVGLEVATELASRLRDLAGPHHARDEVRVVVVERSDVVGPELGPGPRAQIVAALRQLRIEVRLATTVESYQGSTVRLDDGTEIEAQTVVWAGGMRASPLTERVGAPRDGLGRLEVDTHLRVRGLTAVLAAGDAAAVQVGPGQRAPQSCQYAHQMGKVAGRNAVADLLGHPLVELEPDPYVTVLDLGAAGAVCTEGFERRVTATGATAKQVKQAVNRELIHPPVDDRDRILAAADHRAASRPEAG